jgi:hypothetical protein
VTCVPFRAPSPVRCALSSPRAARRRRENRVHTRHAPRARREKRLKSGRAVFFRPGHVPPHGCARDGWAWPGGATRVHERDPWCDPPMAMPARVCGARCSPRWLARQTGCAPAINLQLHLHGIRGGCQMALLLSRTFLFRFLRSLYLAGRSRRRSNAWYSQFSSLRGGLSTA